MNPNMGTGRIVAKRPCSCGTPGCESLRIEFLGGARDGQKRWICSKGVQPRKRET